MNASGRRLLGLLLVVVAVGVPAGILRAACWRDLCRVEAVDADIPFCSLGPTRDLIADGWREERSPQIIAVTGGSPLVGGTAWSDRLDDRAGKWKGNEPAPLWPSREPDVRVPLAIFGPGITGRVPEGATLDSIAPTIASLMGFDRPHPEVRSGKALAGFESGRAPRLVLEIVVAGFGSSDIDEPGWESVEQVVASSGTTEASTGSIPLDPAAILTTIGTGGLPRQHGITGTLVRNDEGNVVPAWIADAPVSVIATLPDDLDESTEQRARIGLVAPALTYRGAIGGNWYLDDDRDEIVVAPPARISGAARRLLSRDYGRDGVTDVVVVVLDATAPADIDRLVKAADEASKGAFVVVVTGTGSRTTGGEPLIARAVVKEVEDNLGSGRIVSGAGPSGFFLDTAALTQLKLSTRDVVQTIAEVRDDGGQMVFSDVFPEIAVAFARYC